MKFLKLGGKMCVFLFAVLVVFGFLEKGVFAAAPTTKAECESAATNGFCTLESICSLAGKTKIGECKDVSSTLTNICCFPNTPSDTSCKNLDCGGGVTGQCKPDCDKSTEKDSGKTCTSSSSPSSKCCIPTSCTPTETAITTTEQCYATTGSDGKKAKCIATPANDCPKFSLDKIGTCGAGADCCASKGTPVPTGTPSTTTPTTSSGTASLNYTPLENLPGFDNGSGDFKTYFESLYKLALWIVGISALFMLVVGGFLYLSSAGNTSLLNTAKKTIYSALIGIIIALVSWLLLDTVNGDLTNLHLSGLTGAVGTGGATTPSTPLGATPPAGSGSGCSGIPTQAGIDKQCGDASQALSDALKCIADKVGTSNMQLSSISDSVGFDRCQNHFSDQACAHAPNSCHYGGSNKAPKSCAADISTKGSSAPKEDIKSAARGCGVPFVNDEGNHVHVSVKGCTCDGHT